MKNKGKCPVCLEKLTDERDYLDGPFSALLEQHEECPNKHYARRFVTGFMCTELMGGEYLITGYTRDYRISNIQKIHYWLALQLGKLCWRVWR